MAMAISSMLILALGGIVTATQTAWRHTQELEDAQAQTTAAFDRIKLMISQAGIYQVNGQPPQVGLAVVTSSWNYHNLPNILVVWTGGRNGGLSDQGVITRIPNLNEILIYMVDPYEKRTIVEFAFPDLDYPLDFNYVYFSNVIHFVIRTSYAEPVLLSNRVKRSKYVVSGEPWGKTTGNLLFEIVKTPSDASLSGISSGTSAWLNLPWPQGMVSSGSGLRQVTVNFETQFESRERSELNEINSSTALPYFGSSSRFYAYSQ